MVQESSSGLQRQERFLRLPDVEALVGIRKSSIYAAVRDGTFPAPVKLGKRAVVWTSSAVDAWIQQRINAGGSRERK